MGAREKNFVVYTGKKPGVYNAWDEARKQLVQVPDSKYDLFPSLIQALDAWLEFCIQTVADKRKKVLSEESVKFGGVASTSNDPSMFGGQIKEISVEIDNDPNDFLVEYTKQGMLYHVCENRCLGMPSWSLSESRVIEGVLHYKYSVKLSGLSKFQTMVFQGKFASTTDLARESVLWVALNSLCQIYGKSIRDFHYYHLKDLQEIVHNKDNEIACMDMEIKLLRACKTKATQEEMKVYG